MAVNKQYVSDATLFLRQMIKDNPELAEKQKELRKTWWDRNVDIKELEEFTEANLQARGYKYYE